MCAVLQVRRQCAALGFSPALLTARTRVQIEFYFSDSNLPFDKFLFEQATDAEDGCAHPPPQRATNCTMFANARPVRLLPAP